MRDIVWPALKLMFFTLLSGALLAAANAVTEEPIRERARITAEQARMAVFRDADGFEAVTPGEDAPFRAVYWAKNGGETLGVVIETAAKGFGGDIDIVVGVDFRSGVISGVRVGEHNETPGLGDKAAEAPFLGQFEGKPLHTALSVSKSAAAEHEIQALSAATITSKGVTDAVNEAVSYARTLMGR